MDVIGMHPEDLKSAIRKKCGSLRAFEEQEGLPRQSVSEILRGRKSQRVTDAIERLLREDRAESIIPANTRQRAAAHRLNAEAR